MEEKIFSSASMMLMLNGAELKSALRDIINDVARELKDEFNNVAKAQVVSEIKPPETDEFISRKKLMERFELSESTLWRYEQRGILNGYQFGDDDDDSRRVYYKKSEVRAALKQKGKHKKKSAADNVSPKSNNSNL